MYVEEIHMIGINNEVNLCRLMLVDKRCRWAHERGAVVYAGLQASLQQRVVSIVAWCESTWSWSRANVMCSLDQWVHAWVSGRISWVCRKVLSQQQSIMLCHRFDHHAIWHVPLCFKKVANADSFFQSTTTLSQESILKTLTMTKWFLCINWNALKFYACLLGCWSQREIWVVNTLIHSLCASYFQV